LNVTVVLALMALFKALRIRGPRWSRTLPPDTVGTCGAFWTVQRLVLMFGVAGQARSWPGQRRLPENAGSRLQRSGVDGDFRIEQSLLQPVQIGGQ